MTWRVAQSLETLLAELNAAAPNRSKASDGSIGDAAHASRQSDHNPWVIDSNGVGVVRARDFTHDPAGGLDCNDLAPRIAAMMRDHPALGAGAYVIWNRRIWSANRDSEGWRPYDGSNPHDHHCHVSVTTLATGYDSTAPWGVMGEPDDMPLTEDQLRAIVREEAATAVAPVANRIGDLERLVKKKAENSWNRDKESRKLLVTVLKQMVENGADLDELVAYVEKHGQPD